MADSTGQVGIKKIAEALKISIGTVDRALHDRQGVSKSTKARVLKMASELGYQPNLAAQSLKLNRRLSIAAVLPREIKYYFTPLREGIRAAAKATVGTQVSLEFHDFARLGVGDEEAFLEAAEKHYDGVIFVPGNTRQFDPIIRRLSRGGTAMMCVGSDAPNSDRIGSVAVHAYVSGCVAAELLSMRLAKKAKVAVFSGELSMMDHAEKLKGFAATLAVQAPHLSLLPALESHEKPNEAYQQARHLMQAHDRPEGLYLSTANSMPVLKALDELKILDKVHTITTDLYHELLPFIEQGKVLATMHQRPFTQGKLAFENLLNYLLCGDKQQTHLRLAPHVVLRSNLSLFTSALGEREDDL